MTMQVGMVGTDGVLIASDTRWMHSPRLRPNEPWAGERYTFNSTKIKISHERGIAVSSARNMETAGHVATTIISTLEDEELLYPILRIETIAAKVLQSAEAERNDAQCLVALVRPFPQLFLLHFGMVNGEWGPFCQKMKTTAIAGDNVNPALYWAERYYEPAPVESLIPLAAQVVVTAHKLNNGSISGLEVVLCTASGIRRLSDESTNELEAKANDWDKAMGELFRGHRQQFTYAPNVVG
jgi:hypothetical protein